MDIQSRVNFGWTKQKGFPQIMSFLKSQDGHILYRVDFGWTKYRVSPQIMSLFKSQDGHILCRANLEWTKYRGVISWSGYMVT